MSGPTPDAIRHPVVDRLPAWSLPYARLARWDRPIGWWLLLLPCWWSAALAAKMGGTWPNPLTLALFLIGAIAMRGAGSTWNDITDRDLDAKVARTRSRPIPSGQVSTKQAFLFLLLQSLVGLEQLQFIDPINRASLLNTTSLAIIGNPLLNSSDDFRPLRAAAGCGSLPPPNRLNITAYKDPQTYCRLTTFPQLCNYIDGSDACPSL